MIGLKLGPRITSRVSRILRAVTATLPPSTLKWLARKLAATRPFGRYPGWRFAIEEQQPTILVLARMCLWSLFRERGIPDPVRIVWYDGLSVDVVLGNDQSRCLYVSGSFEPNEFVFLGEVLSRGSVFIDIGANEGFYTIYAARRVAREGRVIAMEPSPRELHRLQQNIAINRLENVVVDRRAVGRQRGTATLHVADAEHNGQNTLGDFGHNGVTAIEHIQVNLVDLDSLVAEHALARVDVVKMDVEGSELEVLSGAEDVLHKFRPIILFELFDASLRKQGASAPAVLDFLRARGYRFLTFDDATGSPRPADEFTEMSQNVIAVHDDSPVQSAARLSRRSRAPATVDA